MIRCSTGKTTEISAQDSRQGWYVVAGAFLILTFGFGSAYSFGTFFTPLQDAFGASRASVSAAFSLAILTLFSIGPLTGTLADRLGPRALAAGGTALVGCGLMIASFAQALWQVQAAFALCIGGGVGMAYVPAVGAVQKRLPLLVGPLARWSQAQEPTPMERRSPILQIGASR